MVDNLPNQEEVLSMTKDLFKYELEENDTVSLYMRLSED